MIRFVPLSMLALVLALPLTPARAEEASEAGKRIAGSLLKQLAAADPAVSAAVKAVAVKPFGESGAAKGTGHAKKLQEAISAALAASGKVQVRDYDAVQKIQKEQATAAVAKGTAAAPSPVQAIVAGDVLGGDAGAALKADVRLVNASNGSVIATESATIGAPSAA